MEIEEFKESLKPFDKNSTDKEWKEKMMMVTKLFLSFGFGLKEVEKHTVDGEIHFFIQQLVESIVHSDSNIFYSYVRIKNELERLDKSRGKIADDKIKSMLTEKELKDGTDLYDYSIFAKGALVVLNERSKKFKEFLKEELSEKGPNDPIQDECCEYILNNPSVKLEFEKAYASTLLNLEKQIRNDLKADLISKLININVFLNKCGYLEQAKQINNAVMDKYNIPMKVSMEEAKDSFNLNNLTTEEYYNQFTIEELLFQLAFYSNRMGKIVDNIYVGMYLHYKLDTFYDSIAYGEIDSKYDIDDARIVLKQKSFLEKLAREQLEDCKKFLSENPFADDSEIDKFYKSDECKDKYGKVYTEYFGRFIKENNFMDDYQLMFAQLSVFDSLYQVKNFSLENLMFALSQNKTSFNFGLIKEERPMKNELGEEMILIGVDYKEFPTIRLHYPKQEFEIFKDRFFAETEFPTYQGNDDFTIGNTSMNTHILYKFPKMQKREIKALMDYLQKTDPDGDLAKFVRHMYENIHPKQNKLNAKKRQSGQGDEFGDK